MQEAELQLWLIAGTLASIERWRTWAFADSRFEKEHWTQVGGAEQQKPLAFYTLEKTPQKGDFNCIEWKIWKVSKLIIILIPLVT